MDAFEATMRSGGDAALRETSRFFTQTDPVYDSLREIAKRLAEVGIPYAVLDGMALVAHGYRRTTEGVEILIKPEGLERAPMRSSWASATARRSRRVRTYVTRAPAFRSS